MVLVSMKSTGYTLSHADGDSFYSDNQHEYLFDFVAKDLTELNLLMSKYITKGFDIDSKKEITYDYTASDLKDIELFLHELHPYFRGLSLGKALVELLVGYMSVWLSSRDVKKESTEFIDEFYRDDSLDDFQLYKTIEEATAIHQDVLQADYSKLLKRILTPVFDKYTALDHGTKEGRDSLIRDIQQIHIDLSNGSSIIEETQKRIHLLLFWILDSAAPKVNALSISHRDLLLTSILEPGNKDSLEHDKAQQAFMSKLRAIKDSDYHNDPDGIPSDMLEALDRVVKIKSSISDEGEEIEYNVSNLFDLLYLEIRQMINQNTAIRKCQNCRKYFILDNKRNRYCKRIAPGESTQTCKDVGAMRVYESSLRNDILLNALRRETKVRNERVRRGYMKADVFILWRELAKEKLQRVHAGELDQRAFLAWLRKDDPDRTVIKVIGIGGGGLKALRHISVGDLEGINCFVHYVMIDTDADAMRRLPAGREILIKDEDVTDRESTIQEVVISNTTRDKLSSILEEADIVFILAGAGGWTGSSLALQIAELAKQRALTVWLLTRPSQYEGQMRVKRAEETIGKLVKSVDSILIISCDTILEGINSNGLLNEAYKSIDETLTQSIKSIIDLISSDNQELLNYQAIASVFENGGAIRMGVGQANGQNSLSRAAYGAIAESLGDMPLKNAKRVLISIVGDSRLSLEEIDEACSIITDSVDSSAEIIVCKDVNDRMGDCRRITIIATKNKSSTNKAGL